MKKDLKKQLKSKYAGKSYEELVNQIHIEMGNLRKSQQKATEILYYMRLFGRWMDDPRYKKTVWGDWLMAEFNMRPSTFESNRYAWMSFPKESKKYGPGLPVAVKTKCGDRKVPIVLKAVEKREAAKKRPLKHEEIQKIIEQHQMPPVEKPPKPDLKLLETKAIQAEQETAKANKAIESKDEQIAKLKATVARLQHELAEKDHELAEKDKLLAMFAPIAAKFNKVVPEIQAQLQ